MNRNYYESLTNIDSIFEDKFDEDLVVTDDIFIYHQVNCLNNCLLILLLICHCFHILLFGGDISPTITRFKMDDYGIFSLILNILVPSLFFVQGWLKALEVHKHTSFFKRLHFEYILPMLIYILFYLISILFKNDTRLENLTIEEFTILISQSESFNPGFLSTILLLFMVNFILDSITLVLVPNFYTSYALITHTVDTTFKHENNFNENANANPNQFKEKSYFSILKNFSIYKFIYCLLIVSLYNRFIAFLNDVEPIQVFINSRTFNYMSVILLFFLCKFFKNNPRIFYFICITAVFIEFTVCSSFGSYFNSKFSVNLITTFHLLLYIYLSGIIISCMRLNIFNNWTTSLFFTLCTALCYLISIDYSKSIISPLIFPTVLSIKSRFLTFSQIFSSIFAILSLSILLFKYVNIGSDDNSKGSGAINSVALFCFSAMSCISSVSLFLE